MSVVHYKPYSERTPDIQYRSLLARILATGEWSAAQQGGRSLELLGPQMTFNLENGFPIITERDLVSASEGKKSQFAMAVGELCAFLNGARTQDELEKFGVTWWKSWVTEEKCRKRGLEPGDLGPGSYGAAMRAFPTAEGEPFDQLKTVLRQMKEKPTLKTHILTPYIPQYIYRYEGGTQKVVVVPCHMFLHFTIYVDTNTIHLHHIQRSADSPVGLVFNMMQYAALLMMMAQVLGYQAGKLHYTILNAHIFEDEGVKIPTRQYGQMEAVEMLLQTEPQCFPTVTMDPDVDDLFAFRPEHFSVSDYHPQNGRMRIWTPV